MAAASVSASRPPSTAPRPNPPTVHTSVTSTSPSPSLSSKRPPSASNVSSSQTNGTSSQNVAPRNTLRRRDSQRISIGRNNRNGVMDAKKTLNEPYVRTTEFILHKFRGKQPSLVVHLHPTHFRFDQQDGSFGYNSPMKVILEHIKAQSVPHEILEELLQSNVPFYDGCLIVEIHDHKSGPVVARNSYSDTVGDSKLVSFSIHNYTEHLTPSPHVPYPSKAQSEPKPKDISTNDSEISQDQSSLATAKKSSPVYTTVLHPTPLSRHKELMLLATTPVPDQRGGGRRQGSLSARDAGTPAILNPPTPLSSIPPTPGGSRGPPAKRRMILEEKDIHSFEGDILRATEPPLFLEPAESFDGVQAALKMLKDPLHDHAPSTSKARKRTTAELAADEAQAAGEERIALLMDERLEPSLSASGAGSGAAVAEGHNAAKDFEPNFARFKALEDIKRRLEEDNRRRKEEELQMQKNKKEQQEAEAQRQREAEEARQQRVLLMQRQAAMAQAQAHTQQANMRGGQLPAHMIQNQHLQQGSQGPHSSPIMRNHTPQNSSPLSGNIIHNNATSGTQLAPSMSNQVTGPGSPPRPGSAMQAHPGMGNPMARQVSQQPSQHSQSRAGTPQMASSTPHMGQNMPARHMTPQPGMNQGSPISGAHQTPMMAQAMANNPQMNGGQMQQNPQQIAAMIAARRNQQLQMQQRQNQMQGQGSPPNQGQFMSQMSPQQQQMQMQMMQAQRGQQPNGQFNPNIPPNMQNLQQGMTAQQQQQQAMRIQQERQRIAAQQVNAQNQNPQHPQQTPGQGMPNGASMTPSMSQTSTQSPFMQQQMQGMQNQMPQQGQGGPQMNLQQNPQLAAQQQQQQQQNMLMQFYNALRKQNGGQLPPDADVRYANYRRQQQAQRMAQHNMASGQGQPPGSAGGQHPPAGMMNAQQMQQQQQQQQAQMANMQRQRQLMFQQQQQQQRNQQMQQGQQARMGGGQGMGQGSPG